MSALTPLADFMRAVDRDIARKQRDRLDPFREFGEQLERDRQMRASGQGGSDYFKTPTWNFLRRDE